MELSHLDQQGAARMVDVGIKPATPRVAQAQTDVIMQPSTLELLLDDQLPKGDVLATARIAGIMAAKRTSELIPLCHPIALDSVSISLTAQPEHSSIRIISTVRCTAKTGVEMEALVAVQVAALTLYDMVKAVDRTMIITNCFVRNKSGGARGDFVHPNTQD